MFYTGDWLKDQELGKCDPMTRGIWIDMVCHMHETGRSGEISGTPVELSRTCRCTPEQIIIAANELIRTETAEVYDEKRVTLQRNGVTDRNQEIIIACRRMVAEAEERKSNADKQKRYRDKQKSPDNTDELPESNPSSSYSYSYSSSNSSKKKREMFIKPVPSEVTEYAKTIGFALDGSDFCNFYEARGWKLSGNIPMKSWKAAVRTWKTRQKDKSSGKIDNRDVVPLCSVEGCPETYYRYHEKLGNYLCFEHWKENEQAAAIIAKAEETMK